MRRTALPADALDATDRALINVLQDGLPVSHAPFSAVAARLALSEAEVVDRLAHLREIGAITRFGPFLDAAAMGGAFCLCAMAVPAARTAADEARAADEYLFKSLQSRAFRGGL